jgi:hypothetical protein
MVGEKRVVRLYPLDFCDGLDFGERLDRAAEGVSGNFRTRTPSLVNSYRRRYFAVPDGSCRVTVDSGMRFYSPLSAIAGDRFYFEDHRVVIEMKFEACELERISPVIAGLGYRIGKNSKYVNGVDAVYFGRDLTCPL